MLLVAVYEASRGQSHKWSFFPNPWLSSSSGVDAQYETLDAAIRRGDAGHNCMMTRGELAILNSSGSVSLTDSPKENPLYARCRRCANIPARYLLVWRTIILVLRRMRQHSFQSHHHYQRQRISRGSGGGFIAPRPVLLLPRGGDTNDIREFRTCSILFCRYTV